MDPIARIEWFLSAAAGEYDGELPEPVTRIEQYLKKVIERIESGSSVSPESIDAAIEAYLNLHDADIVTEQELADALSGKVDKNGDKTLTDINYSDAEQAKVKASYESRHTHNNKAVIDGITAAKVQTWDAAKPNVNADWDADSGDAQILNKPDLSGFITRLVNDLANYYPKSQTYTQAEINALISTIPKFKIEVVQTLPQSDISATTVYLVPDTNASSPNLYTEYIYVNNAWERLGTQTVDLSGYVTVSDLNAALTSMIGATASTGGTAGLVPAPAAGDNEKYLKGDGTWATVPTIDQIYPIGSIYMSVNNVNPATLFGGTWEQLKDKFLLGAGDTYSAGSTGGEATHTLTIQEMPEHQHSVNQLSIIYDFTINAGGETTGNVLGPKQYSGAKFTVPAHNTNYTGNGQAHNNMPPYLTVYMWKRTA